MKKSLLSLVVLGAMSAATANAATLLEIDPRGYFGADYKYLGDIHSDKRVKDGTIPKDLASKYANALGVTAGLQVNDYVGVEASVSTTVDNVAKSGTGIDADITLYSFGITGQYPLIENVYLKGLIGAGWSHIDAKALVGYYNDTDSGLVARLGLGYQLSQNSVVEGTYNHEVKTNGVALQYKYLF